MTTRVVSRRATVALKGDVYIGRPSAWGNRFVIGVDGNRVDVIEKYRAWITSDDRVAVALRQNLYRLRGKRLVCWCAPAPCHGDVLAELADGEVT
jgi:hypothetical protein